MSLSHAVLASAPESLWRVPCAGRLAPLASILQSNHLLWAPWPPPYPRASGISLRPRRQHPALRSLCHCSLPAVSAVSDLAIAAEPQWKGRT